MEVLRLARRGGRSPGTARNSVSTNHTSRKASRTHPGGMGYASPLNRFKTEWSRSEMYRSRNAMRSSSPNGSAGHFGSSRIPVDSLIWYPPNAMSA